MRLARRYHHNRSCWRSMVRATMVNEGRAFLYQRDFVLVVNLPWAILRHQLRMEQLQIS